MTLAGHPFDTAKVRLQTQSSTNPIYCKLLLAPMWPDACTAIRSILLRIAVASGMLRKQRFWQCSWRPGCGEEDNPVGGPSRSLQGSAPQSSLHMPHLPCVPAASVLCDSLGAADSVHARSCQNRCHRDANCCFHSVCSATARSACVWLQGVQSPLVGQVVFRSVLFGAFGAAKRWLSTNKDGTTRALTTADFYKVSIRCSLTSTGW